MRRRTSAPEALDRSLELVDLLVELVEKLEERVNRVVDRSLDNGPAAGARLDPRRQSLYGRDDAAT